MSNNNFITLQTTTSVLAYLHRHDCKFLPKRCLTGTHLNTLTAWIGKPTEGLRTARAHRYLAAHLALLYAAKLLDVQGNYWTCTPTCFAWLRASSETQLSVLQESLRHKERWQDALGKLGFQDVIPIDFTAFIDQVLAHQFESLPLKVEIASWVETNSQEMWLLALPQSPQPASRFHLLQLGHWMPEQPLRITPVTIAAASKRGYSILRVEHVLSEATGKPLNIEKQQQLLTWWKQQDSYRIRTVQLLSTRKPEQLTEIMAVRRLRNRIYEQVNPRHAIVSLDIVPSLRRWLAQHGYFLDFPDSDEQVTGDPHPAYVWLGLRLLTELSKLIDLPFRVPYASLELAEIQLTSLQLTELEAQAQTVVDDLRNAIRGRDSFFPANQPVTPELLAAIKQALDEEKHMEIAYQSLADNEPHIRRVEPLRLEQRGHLMYLHAYCYQAEANRVFRLDRIYKWRLLNYDEAWEDGN